MSIAPLALVFASLGTHHFVPVSNGLTFFERARLLTRVALLIQEEQGIRPESGQKLNEILALVGSAPGFPPIDLKDLLEGLTMARLGAVRQELMRAGPVKPDALLRYADVVLVLVLDRERAIYELQGLKSPFTDDLPRLAERILGERVTLDKGNVLFAKRLLRHPPDLRLWTARTLIKTELIATCAEQLNRLDAAADGSLEGR